MNVDDEIIREPECFKRTKLSRTTRWRLEQEDQFPRRVRLGPNSVGWKLSAILTWIADRQAVGGGDDERA